MKRREFFKVTAGVVVSATAGGLLDVHPGDPELPDPDYDHIVTSAFPVEDSDKKDLTQSYWNFDFPKEGGKLAIPGYSNIKAISATGVDDEGCRVRIMPSGIPYPQGAPELEFVSPRQPDTLFFEPVWFQCTDAVIRVYGRALLSISLSHYGQAPIQLALA